jgi:hypothetical protein
MSLSKKKKLEEAERALVKNMFFVDPTFHVIFSHLKLKEP